jgi:hypothetical protein
MMTLKLSSHTRLMNLIINLSIKNRICEPILYNNNYELDSIELEFNKIDGERISIDLLLKNGVLNKLLFIECKDGGLEIDQANRYRTLSAPDILNAKITNLSGKINHEIAYIGTEDKKDKLIRDIQKGSYTFPVIIDQESKMSLEYNNFACELLQNIFANNGGVKITRFSNEYYPFGKDDSDAYILSRLWPALVKNAVSGTEFDVEDLLMETHRSYNLIDNPSVKELKSRIGNILNELSKGVLNDFFVFPSKKRFKVRARGALAFGSKLKKYIEKADKTTPPENQKAAQMKLFDF